MSSFTLVVRMKWQFLWILVFLAGNREVTPQIYRHTFLCMCVFWFCFVFFLGKVSVDFFRCSKGLWALCHWARWWIKGVGIGLGAWRCGFRVILWQCLSLIIKIKSKFITIIYMLLLDNFCQLSKYTVCFFTLLFFFLTHITYKLRMKINLSECKFIQAILYKVHLKKKNTKKYWVIIDGIQH